MDTAISLKAHNVVDASYEHVQAIVVIDYHGASASRCAHGLVVEHLYHAPCTTEQVLGGNQSSLCCDVIRAVCSNPRLCESESI